MRTWPTATLRVAVLRRLPVPSPGAGVTERSPFSRGSVERKIQSASHLAASSGCLTNGIAWTLSETSPLNFGVFQSWTRYTHWEINYDVSWGFFSSWISLSYPSLFPPCAAWLFCRVHYTRLEAHAAYSPHYTCITGVLTRLLVIDSCINPHMLQSSCTQNRNRTCLLLDVCSKWDCSCKIITTIRAEINSQLFTDRLSKRMIYRSGPHRLGYCILRRHTLKLKFKMWCTVLLMLQRYLVRIPNN